ncbi:hypothetical protein Mapa_009890 [Marchantia paleacea]|nr:hypothetical protein Mapa_009890 [Marchantia paleacea]
MSRSLQLLQAVIIELLSVVLRIKQNSVKSTLLQNRSVVASTTRTSNIPLLVLDSKSQGRRSVSEAEYKQSTGFGRFADENISVGSSLNLPFGSGLTTASLSAFVSTCSTRVFHPSTQRVPPFIAEGVTLYKMFVDCNAISWGLSTTTTEYLLSSQ